MSNLPILNLLVIDGNQLYAERLVELVSTYYKEVNLGFLDSREELIKALRHQWDVLIFGKAYEMGITDIVGILQEQQIDLPIICLARDDLTDVLSESGLPSVLDGSMIKALNASNESQVALSICLLHNNLLTRQQLKKIKDILSESEQRADILIKNSKSAVAYIDEGIHIFANNPYLELFGFEDMNDILGVPVIDLIAGGDNVKGFKQFLKRFDKGNRDQVEFEFESRRLDGSTFEAKLQLAAASLEGQPVTQIIIQQNQGVDAVEIAKQVAAAERQDNLTGLDNRLGFEENFTKLYDKAVSGQVSGVLLYVRIDNIGKINSSLGLQGTDATIKQVAYALDEFFEEGVVSRFSDHTFAILLEDTSAEKAVAAANTIREKIADMMIEVGKRTTETTISIGMVMLDKNIPEKNMVLDRAIEALNQVLINTDNTGNGIHMYDPSQHASSNDDALAETLLNAITHNQFKILYQPIYDINTDSSDLYEVYVRLPLADGTLMTPDQYMNVAKTHNLLAKIDRWLLINACKQLNQAKQTNPKAKLLIHLSHASLTDPQLPNIASQLMKAIGGEEGVLTLQFSEEEVIDYLALAKKQAIALEKVKCGISISHFGATTKSIDVADYIKPKMSRLAKNYVSDLNREENLETIKALVETANQHNIDVLMPYIEEASTMSIAWSVGARYLQGDYLQAPSETIVTAE